jgi:DNA-binding CsgD family transcriptional regulator
VPAHTDRIVSVGPLAVRLGIRSTTLFECPVSDLSQRPYDPKVTVSRLPSEPANLEPLSPRERGVLEMTSQGFTNAQVATMLSVSVHTVKFHLASVYRKLGVSNRTEAAALYVRAGRGTGEPGEGDDH